MKFFNIDILLYYIKNRNNMLQTFVKSISKCSLLMNILYIMIFVLSALL